MKYIIKKIKDEKSLKEMVKNALEHNKSILADGRTWPVLENICMDLRHWYNLDCVYQGRTIYLKKENKFIKVATVAIYREHTADGYWVSSVDNYQLYI